MDVINNWSGGRDGKVLILSCELWMPISNIIDLDAATVEFCSLLEYKPAAIQHDLIH